MNTNYYKKHEPFFGSWYIKKQIGEGSFGKVFEAEREDFGRVYKSAIKIITIPQNESEIKSAMAEGMDEQSTRSYFREIVSELISEFDIMSKLKGNTNIVSYEDHAVFEHEEGIGWDIVIRMELLTPLLDYVQYNPLEAKDVVKLGSDMCSALEVCRKHNIIHRDIKPQNIFVSSNGNFKLGDFGIARTVEKTTSGLSKKGTYTYMAPEVYKGQPYNVNVDIYSLGIVLYQFLNQNRTPFLPEYPAPITYTAKEQALEKRIKGELIPPLKSVSRELSDVVLKACAYNPRDRYSDATEFKNALMNVSSFDEDSIKDRADEFGDEGTVGIFSNDPVAQNATLHETSGIPIGQPAIDDSPFGRNYDYNAETDEDKTTSLFTKTESGTVGMFGETNNAPSAETEVFENGGFERVELNGDGEKEKFEPPKRNKKWLKIGAIVAASIILVICIVIGNKLSMMREYAEVTDIENTIAFPETIKEYTSHYGKSKEEVLLEYNNAKYHSTFSGGDYYFVKEDSYLIFNDYFLGFQYPFKEIFPETESYIENGQLMRHQLENIVGISSELINHDESLGSEQSGYELYFEYEGYNFSINCDYVGNIDFNNAYCEMIINYDEEFYESHSDESNINEDETMVDEEYVLVPDMIGSSLETAKTKLIDAGLIWGVIIYVESEKPINTIVAQEIKPGKEVERNTSVNLKVSLGNDIPTKQPMEEPEPYFDDLGW